MPAVATPIPEPAAESWCVKTGLRPTHARRGLFAVINSMPRHFDVEELVVECRRRDLAVSRATIYRTLPKLCDAGLLRSMEFGDGRHVFSRCPPGDVPQAEIFVVDCGRIVEVPAPFLSWYAQTVTSKAGYELIGQRLQTFARCRQQETPGACENCAAKPKSTGEGRTGPAIPLSHPVEGSSHAPHA